MIGFSLLYLGGGLFRFLRPLLLFLFLGGSGRARWRNGWESALLVGGSDELVGGSDDVGTGGLVASFCICNCLA